jgi:subtilisin family serine protease
MNRRRRRRDASLAVAVALSVLVAGCAPGTADTAVPPARAWSYVGVPRPSPDWWRDQVGVDGARAKHATGGGTTIAILDTGVVPGHPDVAMVEPGVATCGTDPTDTADRRGHGTQLAGIALGRDPGGATLGVAPEARLLPVKVDCGVVTADALVRGVEEALARRADIVLIALGGYPPDAHPRLADLVRAYPETLFVVASMWDGRFHAAPDWTARPNAIVVAAMTLDAGGKPGPYNARRGDVWAPGRDVPTATTPPDARHLMQGNSAASAIVAGCAALVKQRTGYAAAPLKAALLAGADPQPGLGPGPNRRLNCGRAIP